jgi:SAM-dependent methyltransferase
MDILTNVSETPNDLCFIMNFFGSDKGHPINDSNHCYTRFYHELFKPDRYESLRVFELGLGTNNPNFPSNMGPDGKPGASLRGWKQYFPNASVFGADIDSGILFQEDRIRTFQCDQNDANSIKTLWSNTELEEGFNIIIEDGLHIFESNVHFFENSYHKLKVGGIFIIEDVMYYTLERWNQKLQEWAARFPNMSFRIYVIPYERNPHDNTVVIAKRNY